jgi:ribonuclease-3
MNDNDIDTMVAPKKLQTSSDTISAKIANLMHACQQVLNHDSVDDNNMKNYIGEEAWEHLSELQYALSWKTAGRGILSAPKANLPKSRPTLTVTSWKASEIPTGFPPLPKVLDLTLETAAFTHLGMSGGRIGDLSYERLEWVGDAYLQMTCTLLISQTFPGLLPGKCSQLRERCVKNLTLSAYARHYGFEKRAQIPDDLFVNSKRSGKEHDMTKIMGDIFEAYVAAVVLSDPENGVARVTGWLKKLWSIELKKEIVEVEKTAKFDSPMWRLRGEVDKVEIRSSDPVQLGPKEQLQKLLGSKGINLTYKDAAPEKKDKNNKLPLFTVGVYLDGYGKKALQLGFGTANGKKDAGKKAAAMALGNKALMKELTDKKKVHDAQLEREREALEGLGGT